MNYLRPLLVVICFVFLQSCSTTPTQEKVINIDVNDPQDMYVTMMNYVLPMKINGITMEKVYKEGENGVVHTAVGEYKIPKILGELETKVVEKIFEGQAKEEVCNDSSKEFFALGLYAKFIYRDKNSGNQIVVILDEDKCNDNETQINEFSDVKSVGPFQKRYIQCFTEPTLEEGEYNDVCLRIGHASYHFENENKVLIHWGGWNDMFYEDDSRAWFEKFKNTEFSSDERSFKGSIVFDKRLKMYPDEVQWNFEMLFNGDYSKIIGGQVETVAEDGTVTVALVYQQSDDTSADRVNDIWYEWSRMGDSK